MSSGPWLRCGGRSFQAAAVTVIAIVPPPISVFADAELIERIASDRSLEQLQNVATLPGIREAALAMPDIHQG